MSDTLKLKYKVGEIEFEAEGPADAVEQQRINFMNAVLPAAVNAMVQTRSVSENKAYIETAPQQSLLEAGHTEAEPVSDAVDYSRVGLSSFLKKYGQLTEQDFTLFAAYFDEKNLMDIQVMSTMGLTEDDLDAIRALDGVLDAEGSYATDVL